MLLDPFFQPLRDCTSFESITEWLENPQNTDQMFQRSLARPGFIRTIEFQHLEFGPTDGLFPPSWAGRLIAYTCPLEPAEAFLVFRGSGIELNGPSGSWRGHNWVLRSRFHMLVDDFAAMAIADRLRDRY
jgi:hypothetical protein